MPSPTNQGPMGASASSSATPANQPASSGAMASSADRYVDLGSSFPKWSVWSNDPKDMKLDTYFSLNRDVPGVSQQYNIGLRPVIVKRDTSMGSTYLLTDSAGRFFIWHEEETDLWLFKDTKLKLSDVVDKVRKDIYDTLELVQQFQ